MSDFQNIYYSSDEIVDVINTQKVNESKNIKDSLTIMEQLNINKEMKDYLISYFEICCKYDRKDMFELCITNLKDSNSINLKITPNDKSNIDNIISKNDKFIKIIIGVHLGIIACFAFYNFKRN